MARSLREASFSKKLLVMEYVGRPEEWPHDTLKDRDRRTLSTVAADVRSRREEDERGVVAAEEKRKRRLEEKHRERQQMIRQQILDERRSEAVRVWQEDQDELRWMEEERQRAIREEKEAEDQLRAELRENERQKRIPVTCETCSGSGLCQDCCGTGRHEATFLSSAPGHAAKELEFGVKARGCVTCRGCDQGIRGELHRGTGKCVVCAGAGKFCTGLCGRKPQSRERTRRTGTRSASRMPTANQEAFQGAPSTPSNHGSSPGLSPGLVARRRLGEAAPEPGQIWVCGLCRGSLQPSLDEARWLWATNDVE